MKRYLALGILALSIGFLSVVPLPSFAANPFADITFPITELGNCGSMHECKIYCDDPAHQDACMAYAEANGLLPPAPPSGQEGGGRTQPPSPGPDVNAVLQSGGGPGGCTTPSQCQTYCDTFSHINECLAFGEAHHLLSADQVAQGEKVAAALKSGVETPGGCTSREECQTYCSDPAHRQECMAFAQATGLGPPQGGQGGGQGGPGDQGQAGPGSMLGPGGCDSPDSCTTFCNDPSNQSTCIAFAKEHGFTQGGDQGDVQALSRIAAGLANAPDSVKQCLSSALGADGLAALEAGTAPSLDKMDAIKNCFEEGRKALGQSFTDQVSSTPGVKDCIVQAIGKDALDQMESGVGAPDPALAAKVRQCFNQGHQVQGGPPQGPQGQGPFGPPPMPGGQPGGPNGPAGPNYHLDNGSSGTSPGGNFNNQEPPFPPGGQNPPTQENSQGPQNLPNPPIPQGSGPQNQNGFPPPPPPGNNWQGGQPGQGCTNPPCPQNGGGNVPPPPPGGQNQWQNGGGPNSPQNPGMMQPMQPMQPMPMQPQQQGNVPPPPPGGGSFFLPGGSNAGTPSPPPGGNFPQPPGGNVGAPPLLPPSDESQSPTGFLGAVRQELPANVLGGFEQFLRSIRL